MSGRREELGRERSTSPETWSLPEGRSLDLGRARVMGIVNVTPDSFSDGGDFFDPRSAVEHALRLADQGAGIIDVGGESTRPGAANVDEAEEMARVVPVIRELARRTSVPISIDTTKASVARAALDAGAAVVNDVSGLMMDPKIGDMVARYGAGLVVMHMRGNPRTMRDQATYEDVVAEVMRELSSSVARALDAGVARRSIVVDPGIGFAKTASQSLTLLRRIPELLVLGYPVLVGPSRKSFIHAVTGAPVELRAPGTLAAVVAAVMLGAKLVRVHDVAEAVQAVAVADAIRTAPSS